MIKLALLTLSTLLVASGSAMAADLTMQAPAPAAADVSYDWTGGYVGVNAGYGWGTLNYSPTLGVPNPPGSFGTTGWLGGVTAGYNTQMGSLVLGIEGDIDATNITGSGAAFDPLAGSPSVPSFTMNWLGTARGRIGFAADNFLVYATGGLAVGGLSGGITNVVGAGDNRTQTGTQSGWVAGAGVEAGLSQNVSVKAEYLYTDLGTANYTFTGVGAPVTNVAVDVHPTTSLVRVGLNYKF